MPSAPLPAAPQADIDAIALGLRRMVKALAQYSQDVRAEYGLTGPQLWAIKTLASRGELAIRDLARALAVKDSAVSLLLDRLEARGLVRRTRAGPDRRFVRVSLTARGLAMARGAPVAVQGRLLHGLRRLPRARVRGLRAAVELLVNLMEAGSVKARFFFEDGP